MSTPSSACPLPGCASWDLRAGVLVVLPVILSASGCGMSQATQSTGAGSLCGVLAAPGGSRAPDQPTSAAVRAELQPACVWGRRLNPAT